MICLAVAATLPPVVLLMATGLFYTPWSWLPRIVMQFTAGALVCAAVRKLQPSDRARKSAGVASLLLAGGHRRHPVSAGRASDTDDLRLGGTGRRAVRPAGVDPGDRASATLPALLSLRPMVYLGHISFSLYMVHELVHTTWNWMVMQFELRLGSDLAGKAVLVGLLAVAFVGAALLYHFVEEPARRWMRGMMSPPRDVAADSGRGKLQTIDGQREERTPVVSARAG